MQETVDDDVTKWQTTRVALTEALATMPGATAVGMLLYPNQATTPSLDPRPVSACVNIDALVAPEPLQDGAMVHRDELLTALWNESVVDGGTPTHDAYAYALSELMDRDDGSSAHMLLITDGLPTFSLGCVGTGRADEAVDVDPIIHAIAAAREDGIRTFVIGSPGSEAGGVNGVDARPWLSRAASAGGTAREGCSHDGPNFCHFDMVDEPDFAAGLSAALGEITGSIMPCEYVIPEPPPGKMLPAGELDIVWTLADGSQKAFLLDDTGDCEEGWRYTADGRRIALCPQSCERIRAASNDHLEIFFRCTDNVVR
jgi:hypothetical protein